MDNDSPHLDPHSLLLLSPSISPSLPSLVSPDLDTHTHTVSGVLALPYPSNCQEHSSMIALAPSGALTPAVSTPRYGLIAAQTPQRKIHKVRRMLSAHPLGRAEKEEVIMPLVKEEDQQHGGGSGMKRTLRSVKSFLYERDSDSTSKATMKTMSSNNTRSPSSGVRRKPSIAESDFLAIRARVPGVFTPSLPAELWLVILRFAAAELFIPCTSACSSSPSPFSYASASHLPLHLRQTQYNVHLKWKAGLTRVCRVWNWVGQEVLYEAVWIGRGREGRALASRLGGDAQLGGNIGMGIKSEVAIVVDTKRGDGYGEKAWGERRRGLGWFGRIRGWRVSGDVKNDVPVIPTTIPYSRTRRPSLGNDCASLPVSSTNANVNVNVGRFIRYLHIETPSMEKCSPHDLLLILQHCPRLEAYVDCKSVRRPMHPLALSVSPVVPFSSSAWVSSSQNHEQINTGRQQQQHLLTPDVLLHTLLSRPLKHLTWTNYEHNGADYAACVRFYEDVVAPRLRVRGVGDVLESLEVLVSGAGVFGMGGRATEAGAWGVAGDSGGIVRQERVREDGIARLMTPLSNGSGVSSMLLTELTARYTTTQTFTSSSSSFGDLSGPGSSSSLLPSPSSTASSTPSSLELSIDGFAYTLVLPALKSLKVTLDNATFAVLSSWDMPTLTHLSVISADFGYAGAGFRRFFEVHGSKIVQLEFGHSSGDIEEAWLTQPPMDLSTLALTPTTTTTITTSPANSPFSIPLQAWCPNLKEFICSADAEWNWQSPDWIAPHVLLPAHPGLEFIGVRDMERRVRGDADDAERRRRGDAGLAGAGGGGGGGRDEDPYFMLAEQFGSLLRKDAFPSLLYVRDMSWESDVMRRTGKLSVSSSSAAAPCTADLGTVQASSSVPRWFAASNSSASPFISARGTSSRKLVSKASQAAIQARLEEDERDRTQGRKVLGFWAGVLEKCRERGVWLEDCRGVNVTMSDLRRAGV